MADKKMSGINKKSLGAEGEQRSVQFLAENNYSIITTNYRVGRIGEIDIIARDSEYICFIEVKTRTSLSFGAPIEAVNIRKQEKIRQIASIYLSNTRNMDTCVRFDVVEIIMKKSNSINKIEHINLIKNAF